MANPASARPEDRALPVFRLFYFFLPETSLLRRFPFQIIVVSRVLSEIGQESVFYGALVAVAVTGDAFDASLISVAKMIPAATLGLYGGAVGDALPRRVGLGVGYAAQAAICVVSRLFLARSRALSWPSSSA